MNVKEIGKFLRKRRKFLKITQEDLADISGVSVRTLGTMEQGKANPELDSLMKVCDVLGLELIIEVKR